MAERFERLFALPSNLYSLGSPVIISAGALLKDNQTGSVIVQLKFQSVSSILIKALKVGVVAYDVARKELSGAEEYQYLDLCISNGQTFGSNKAIVMPNVVTRSFSISSITVVLADGTVKDVSMPMTTLPKETSLQSGLKDAELVKQYKLAVNDEAAYIPQETDDLWMCSCGEWNSDNFCTKCRAKKEDAFSAYDIPTLSTKMASRLATERTQREEQQRLAEVERQRKAEQDRIAAEEEAERQAVEAKKIKDAQKRAKLIAIICTPVLVAVLLFAFWINPYIIQPSIKYSEAISLIETEQYEDAYKLFIELGDYKDSTIYMDAFEWVLSFEDDIEPQKYTYDEFGRLSIVERTDEYYQKEIYSYDDAGNLVLIECFDEDGILYTYTYTYHENGLRKTEEYTSATTHILSSYSYDDNGFIISEERSNLRTGYIVKYQYVNDIYGNPKETTAIGSNGQTSSTLEYREYNSYGDVVKFTLTHDDELFYNTTFSYEYNDYGLKTKRTATYIDGDSDVCRYEYILLFHPEKLQH